MDLSKPCSSTIGVVNHGTSLAFGLHLLRLKAYERVVADMEQRCLDPACGIISGFLESFLTSKQDLLQIRSVTQPKFPIPLSSLSLNKRLLVTHAERSRERGHCFQALQWEASICRTF